MDDASAKVLETGYKRREGAEIPIPSSMRNDGINGKFLTKEGKGSSAPLYGVKIVIISLPPSGEFHREFGLSETEVVVLVYKREEPTTKNDLVLAVFTETSLIELENYLIDKMRAERQREEMISSVLDEHLLKVA